MIDTSTSKQAPNPEAVARRLKLREGFHQLGLKTVENRKKMPLLSEDLAKG